MISVCGSKIVYQFLIFDKTSLLLWGKGLQGHRIKPLITQHKQNKRHINKS